MRVVYGAGAVAAMSIMAVGLVQPDWTSTADSGQTDDSVNPTDDSGAIAVLPDGTDLGQADPTGSAGGRGGKVRHITRYIYLKPGQTAPPGATVISASPPPRIVRNHQSNPDPTATPRPHGGGGNNGGGGGGGGNGGGVTTTPKPTQGPAATPRPTPRPTPKPKTRQSGHP